MKFGAIARFALKIAARAAAKQALDPTKPKITLDVAKKAIAEELEAEVVRQVVKRAG